MRIEFLCFMVVVASLPKMLSAVSVKQPKTIVGRAAAALLEATTDASCTLILFTNNNASTFTIHQILEVWRQQWGVTMFHVEASNKDFNMTHSLSQLVPLARRVRQFSWCTVVVVVSHDSAFLAAFAKWSLKGRLLVWGTRLVVVTQLALPLLQTLLSTHWTFSMMNTIFLHVGDNYSRSHQVLSHLPYSPAGPQVVQVASWRHLRGLIITKGPMLFQEKFLNFYGARVNVTALPYPPLWVVEKGPDNTTLYSGTDYNTLSTIATALNFTPHVVPTSSWAEVTRLVSERVSFMSPVYHNVLYHRLKRYDFSFVYEYGSVDFSMAPPGLKPQWQSLYYPLADVVWAATLLALLLIPGSLIMIIKATDEGIHSGKASSLGSGAVYQDMTGMLLGQNLPRRLPSTFSSRVLVGAWLMFGLIIGLSYRCNLTACLTLPKYPQRPETLSELVEVVDRITMPPYGVEFRTFFAKSDSPAFRKLARLMGFVPTIEIGQKEAVEKNQAHLENILHQRQMIAERFTRADGSQMLYIGQESILTGQAAWPLPHDAPYRPVIDHHLMAIVEGGLYRKWTEDLLLEVRRKSQRKQKQLQEKDEALDKNEKTLTALTITHTQGAFILLHLGQVVAAIILAAEILTLRTLTKLHQHYNIMDIFSIRQGRY